MGIGADNWVAGKAEVIWLELRKEQRSGAGRELGCLLCFARIKPGLLGSATAEEETQLSAPAEHVKAKTGEELLTGVSSNSVTG